MSLMQHRTGLMKGYGDGSLTSLTRVDQATSTGANLTVPASVVAGDLLIYRCAATNTVGAPTASLSGWTLMLDILGFGVNTTLACWMKVADGSEASTNIVGVNGTASNNRLLVVLRGNVVLTAVSAVQALLSETNNANPTAQVVTSSGAAVPALVVGFYRSSASVNPRTMTAAKDDEFNNGVAEWLAWKLLTSAANVTVDMDDEGFNTLASWYVNLTI